MNQSQTVRARIISVFVAAGGTAIASTASGQIFLPGTQPNEGGIEFGKVQQCIMCHSETPNEKEADPYFSWSGGMMAQAARDPVYRAAQAIANQDIPGVGEYCIRCHSPRGWLEGRSTVADASALNREDLHGVSCEACHRLVDPLSDEAKGLVEHVPPGYGNGMMVLDPANVVRGPYGDGEGAMPHRVLKSAFHASSNVCATCHDVSNPLYADDVNTQPPFAYGHIERTYSEWLLSDFADMGPEGTCQSCHYPTVEGGGQASRFRSPHRDHFVQHGPVGGSTWVLDATAQLWTTTDVNREALQFSKQRTRDFLKTSATLDLTHDAAAGTGTVRITNLTGHKLPTGYGEGRRMWVNVRFTDAAGNTVGELGTFGPTNDTIKGEAVQVPALADESSTQIYEILPGLSDEQAVKYNKHPGKSFHFVLNDIIVKDNRIPPKGFNNAEFARHLSEPVGAEYADGQYWDDYTFDVPAGTKTITVRLMYQAVTWDYIKFLAEENRTDDWGMNLYQAWHDAGQGQPELMAETTLTLD
ncbi:MAG: hypothetical protein HND57_06120 [Planctomycetes bacterium]|nr:hypothetical protein [Planctomycetota bacterium]